MSRPTLYLTNWGSSRVYKGSRPKCPIPGRRLCAMARPRRFETGDGLCRTAAPDAYDLLAVQASGDIARYRRACESLWAGHLDADRMAPGALTFELPWEIGHHQPVKDGDGLLCACARPGSPRRTHPCHLEILVPFLVRAGWDVILDGRRVTASRSDGTPGVPDLGIVMWADGGGFYDTADFGWPAVSPAAPSVIANNAAPCDDDGEGGVL